MTKDNFFNSSTPISFPGNHTNDEGRDLNDEIVLAWWKRMDHLSVQTKVYLLQDWIDGKAQLMIPADEAMEILKRIHELSK